MPAAFRLGVVVAIAAVTVTGAASAASRPIVISQSGFALHGTLDLPAGQGPFPVVLIIPGSGPTDEDGNTVTPSGIRHGPYRQIAQGLNTAGFAVARMRKRDLPPSSRLATSLEDYAHDAQQALAALRQDAILDPRRVIVLGHSEGGLIALKVSSLEELRALMLAGTPALPLRDVITDQALTLARQRGATDEELSKIRAFQDGFYQALRDYTGTGVLRYGGKTYPEATAGLLKSEIDVDPRELARRVAVPTLVVQGGEDLNVAAENGRLLADTLPRGHLVMIPDMSHVLTVATARNLDQLRTTLQTRLHPQVLPALVQWLKAQVPN